MSQSADPAPRRRRWRPGPDTAIALTALVLAAGGGGYALGASGSGSTITACVSPSDGAVQKIVTAGTCDPALTAISWNEVGPQGATGLPGPVGPAGKDAPVDQTVIALPPAAATKRRGQFVVTLLLPGPGTYLLEGSVAWDRISLTDDAPTTCEMLRSGQASALDTVNLTISKTGPFAGFIQESTVMTVAKPAPSNGPVQQVAVPVPVRFKCIASRSAKSKAPNPRVTFHDWAFTATPVKVSVIPKP